MDDELLRLTRELLESIADGDWPAYERLCDPSLTAFEPEACGQRVEGLGFHKFYFDMRGSRRNSQTTLAQPHVRVVGDVGIVTYVRLGQKAQDGAATSSAFEETRVWQRKDGRWWHVHFHRSPVKVG